MWPRVVVLVRTLRLDPSDVGLGRCAAAGMTSSATSGALHGSDSQTRESLPKEEVFTLMGAWTRRQGVLSREHRSAGASGCPFPGLFARMALDGCSGGPSGSTGGYKPRLGAPDRGGDLQAQAEWLCT